MILSVARRFFRHPLHVVSGYHPLKCPYEEESGRRKGKARNSTFLKTMSDTNNQERAAECKRWIGRRHGICEGEMKDDIRILKDLLFEKAMGDGGLI